MPGVDRQELAQWAGVSSLADETPEGSSIVELSRKLGAEAEDGWLNEGEVIPFRAETRMSGMAFRDDDAAADGRGPSGISSQ